MPRFRFTAGGTVQAADGLYLRRDSDAELLRLCSNREFAYILTSRQMGKSSALEHAAKSLEYRFARVIIDLTSIGAINITPDQWYLGLLADLDKQLSLGNRSYNWWLQNSYLGYTQRLVNYLHKVVLSEIATPIIIFVDEIDTTLSLAFADDFFAAIRYLYNARAQFPELGRLSFVLVGTASPSDLMKDPLRTPFNIGVSVELRDFSDSEILPLADGFNLPEKDAREVLRQVFEWTNGHPYLTQKLCLEASRRLDKRQAGLGLSEITGQVFGSDAIGSDSNLRYVRDMLTRKDPIRSDIDPVAVLQCYRQVRIGKNVPDEERSAVKTRLRLSGVVRRLGGNLVLRNRIYEGIFDTRWVDEQIQSIQESLTGLVRSAEHQREEAERTGIVLLARQLALQAEALLHDKTSLLDRSALLAIESMRLHGSADASSVIRRCLELLARPVVGFKDVRPVTHMLFSRDGKFLFWASDSGQVHAFDLERRREDWRHECSESVTVLESSADDQWIFIGYVSGCSELVGLCSVRKLIAQKKRSHPITAADFTRDSHTIAVAGADNAVMIHVVPQSTPLAILRHDDRVFCVRFSPDGRLLATGGFDRNVKIWSTLDWRPVSAATLSSAITELFFTTSGDSLIACCSDGSISRFDIEGLRLRNHWSLGSRLTQAAISPDRRTLAAGSVDGFVRAWGISDGKELLSISHGDSIASVAFSRDSTLVGAASEDGSVRVWNVLQGAEQARVCHRGPARCLVFHPRKNILASGSDDNAVKVVESHAGSAILLRSYRSSEVGAKCLSRTGVRIASCPSHGMVVIQDLSSGQVLSELRHPRVVRALSFSSDDLRVVVGAEDSFVRLWNTLNATELLRLPVYGAATAVSISHDSRVIASGSDEGQAAVWSLSSGQKVISFRVDSFVHSVACSPSGQHLAVGTADGLLRVMDVGQGGEVLRFKHTAAVTSVAFSISGQYLFSVAGSELRIWTEFDSRPMLLLHEESILDAAFSRDGQQVVSGTIGGNCRIWQLNNGSLLGDIGHDKAVTGVSFTRDGRMVASLSGGAARLFLWRGEDLIEQGAERVGRPLDAEELRKYIGR